jgi:hypothetical protein
MPETTWTDRLQLEGSKVTNYYCFLTLVIVCFQNVLETAAF